MEQEKQEKVDIDALLEKSVVEIGVLKETFENEKRVAIVPSTVLDLLKLGFRVNVEAGAGEESGYSNE